MKRCSILPCSSKVNTGWAYYISSGRLSMLSKPQFVQYGVLNDHDLVKFCIGEVHKVYTKEMQDVKETVLDERMGATKNNPVCPTCSGDERTCPGHFFYIALHQPVYNYKFMGQVRAILSCVCWYCGKCRISKKLLQVKVGSSIHRAARTRMILKLCKAVAVCPHKCQQPVQQCKLEEGRLYEIGNDKLELTAARAWAILTKVSHKTMLLLGYNEDLAPSPVFARQDTAEGLYHPHMHGVDAASLLFKILPVLPPCARVARDKEKGGDRISMQYNEVLKINLQVKALAEGLKPVRRGKTVETVDSLMFKLQEAVNMLVDNSKGSDAYGKNNFLSLKNRIEKKKGRCNSNISGKHSMFCTRYVIASGGSTVPAGWIGVPEEVMDTMMHQELVSARTLAQQQRQQHKGRIVNVIRQGRIVPAIRRANGQAEASIEPLRPGDLIERHINNGERLIMGRQPTIRQESMMALRIMRVKNYPYRPDLSICTPLGGDFDGDN